MLLLATLSVIASIGTVPGDVNEPHCPFCRLVNRHGARQHPGPNAKTPSDRDTEQFIIESERWRRGNQSTPLPSRSADGVLPRIHDLSGASVAWVDTLVAEAVDGLGRKPC